MRARNKYEKRVAELNATLSEDIAVKDVNWYQSISRDWDFGIGKYCYFTLYTNINEFEVKRLYRGYRFTDDNTSHFFFVEILREFNDGEKKTYFSKKRQMGCYFDTFSFNSEIELKTICKNYANYDITQLFCLSCASHTQSDGDRVSCSRINPRILAKVICNNPVAEMLYKSNNPFFYHLIGRTYLKETCRAYVIAKRHGFDFNEDSTPIWLDLVYALIFCKKDWHNPVYVAPKDLQATHDRFVRMVERIDRNNRLVREYRQLEREIAERKELNEMYVEQRQKFFDMVIKKGDLEFKVLRNVDEFLEEGMYMHHCVFKCRYWDMNAHPDSLILSVTLGGNKCETMEINLSTYKIVQCFGKHDQFTNYHKKIVRFMEDHMNIVRAYNEGETIQRLAV